MTKIYKGQVTLEQAGNSYRIRFTYEGKRYCFGTGIKVANETTKNAAIGLAKRVEADILSGRFQGDVEPYKPQRRKKQEINLQSQFTDFLALKKAEVRTSTYTHGYAVHERMIRETILGSHKSIADINENKIKTYLLQWRQRLRYTSVYAIAQVLIGFWDYCQPDVENKINPWRKQLKGLKKDEIVKPEPFTDNERSAILRAIAENENTKDWLSVIKFVMLTGCRPSEAFALTYGDIDLNKRLIIISKGAVNGIVDKTKTGKTRMIPLTHELLECIPLPNDWLEVKSQLVFPHPANNGLINDRQFRFKWQQACKFANVDYRKPYANRHTWTTEAISQGMHPVEAAKMLGNSPDIIYKHYLNIQQINPDKMPKI